MNFIFWSHPADPNGVIESYTIMYTETRTGRVRNVSATALSKEIGGLMEYERYTVIVYALTDKGAGPGSDPLDVLTLEHCEFIIPYFSANIV